MTDPDPDGGAEVRAAMATLVATEPRLPDGADDIERRGRRRVVRRRALAGVALGVFAGAGGLILPGVFDRAEEAPVVAVDDPAPTVTGHAAGDATGAAGGGPAGGAQLASGYPIGEAVQAVEGALPAGVTLGELPMDLGWRPGGVLTLPLAAGGSLTLTVDGGTCAATATTPLPQAQLAGVADAVCASWRAGGSLPVVPAGPPGEERPDLAHQ